MKKFRKRLYTGFLAFRLGLREGRWLDKNKAIKKPEYFLPEHSKAGLLLGVIFPDRKNDARTMAKRKTKLQRDYERIQALYKED